MTEQQEDAVLQITAQYISELQAGQQPRLSVYLTRYPQHAEAIADFVAYYHTVEMQASDDLTISIPLSETSQLVLTRLQAEEQMITPAVSPTTLLIRSDNQPLTLSQVAQKINLSADIVLLLERRRIDPATISDAVISQLAAVSGYSTDDVRSYFTARPILNHPGASRRQRRKVAETSKYHMTTAAYDPLPSFEQVVEASDTLTAEQKTYWLSTLRQEGL